MLASIRTRPALSPPGTRAARRASTARRRLVLAPAAALLLTPVGDGSQAHLDEPVVAPGAITLQEGLFEVGRAPPADIIIAIPTVSSRHATLRVAASSVVVTDLGSTNGTVVDGDELEPTQAAELAPGGEVTFGDKFLARFRLDVVEDPPAQEEEPAASEAPPSTDTPAA